MIPWARTPVDDAPAPAAGLAECRAALAEITAVISSAVQGDLEPRVAPCDQFPEVQALGDMVNHVLDVVDAFVHTVEQYLTYPASAPLQDRLAEAILQTLIEVGPDALATPPDYDARATLMWSATLALNGLIGCGVPQDWSTHMIGHELTAVYGLDHAQTLAVVLPGIWRNRKAEKREKLLQFARRVWHVDDADEDAALEAAIARTEAFFAAMGVATRLRDYGVDGGAAAAAIASRLDARGARALGERESVTPAVVREVLLARA